MGQWDDYSWRYHRDRRETERYRGFELVASQRGRLNAISRRLVLGYEDHWEARKDADWLEVLLIDCTTALNSEKEYGYNNITLKHDVRKIQGVMRRMGAELDRLDP